MRLSRSTTLNPPVNVHSAGQVQPSNMKGLVIMSDYVRCQIGTVVLLAVTEALHTAGPLACAALSREMGLTFTGNRADDSTAK